MIFDLLVETWDEDILEHVLAELGIGRLVMAAPGEPAETSEGYFVVRLKGVDNPERVARVLQRRVHGLRIVEVVNRSQPAPQPAPVPGSFAAQQQQGLIWAD